MRVVSARGDLQNLEDRLDLEPVLLGVDVVDDQRCGRSSSGAKKGDALVTIPLARSSSRLSAGARRSAPHRSYSRRRWPSSISAYTTQPRNVSGLIPSCSPIRPTP